MMNNENGRSMVEMLGVLAIIGVLSVAGIAGYSMAMKKYKTNEMLNTASQLVVLAQAKGNGTGSTADTDNDLTGASMGGAIKISADCTSTKRANNSNKCEVTISGGDSTVVSNARGMAGTYFTIAS